MVNMHDGSAQSELILYACPLGELAAQLDRYFSRSLQLFGENAAHRYMPHCSLTGFFHDLPSSIPFYANTLDRLLTGPFAVDTEPILLVKGILFHEDFHGLLLDGPRLVSMVQDFAAQAESSSRVDTIRVKDWLHLSLAYQFPPEQHDGLRKLAEEMVRPNAEVSWVIRLYERHPGNTWTCHKEWAAQRVI